MYGDEATSADLMLGYAGDGAFFLRLSEPEHTPELVLGPLNQLSPERNTPCPRKH